MILAHNNSSVNLKPSQTDVELKDRSISWKVAIYPNHWLLVDDLQFLALLICVSAPQLWAFDLIPFYAIEFLFQVKIPANTITSSNLAFAIPSLEALPYFTPPVDGDRSLTFTIGTTMACHNLTHHLSMFIHLMNCRSLLWLTSKIVHSWERLSLLVFCLSSRNPIA